MGLVIGRGRERGGREEEFEFVEVMEAAEALLELVEPVEASSGAVARGGQDETKLGLEAFLPAPPCVEDVGFAGFRGLAALPEGFPEAALEGGHDSVRRHTVRDKT